MKILRSAFKHGLTHEEIASAYENVIYSWTQQDNPLKVLMIGMTATCKTVELCYTIRDGDIIVFHAMNCTNAIANRLKRTTKRWP